MKLPKLKKFTPIEILWDDCEVATDPWLNRVEYEEFKTERTYVRSLGYFLEFDKNSIYICGDFIADKKAGNVGDVGRVMRIPLGQIEKITKLC